MNVPQELIAAYVAIVKNEPDYNAAAAHLLNLVLDANKIAQSVQETIDAAKERAKPAQ